VGAAFNIHTGRLNDSPAWVKKAGLQWLHRLIQEPGRLWKRYLVNNSLFLMHLALQLAGMRRPLLEPEVQLSRTAFVSAKNKPSLSLNPTDAL